MSVLISGHNLSKSYSSIPLFSGINLGVHERERLAIVGINGCGKSTLLKLFAGEVTPDEGSVSLKKGTRVIYSTQDTSFADGDLCGRRQLLAVLATQG